MKIGGKPKHNVAGALLLVQFVMMWLVEKPLDLEQLDYLAWAVWLVAATPIAVSVLTLHDREAGHDGGSCVDTKSPIATGVYALVRHPLYLGWMLMHVAVVLLNPNWAVAITGLAGATCVYRFTMQEETFLKEHFGESYRRYMLAVPSFNIVAGAIRLLWKRCVKDPATP